MFFCFFFVNNILDILFSNYFVFYILYSIKIKLINKSILVFFILIVFLFFLFLILFSCCFYLILNFVLEYLEF